MSHWSSEWCRVTFWQNVFSVEMDFLRRNLSELFFHLTPLVYCRRVWLDKHGSQYRHSNECRTYGSTRDVVRCHSNQQGRYTHSIQCVYHIRTLLSRHNSRCVQYTARCTCLRSDGCSCRRGDLTMHAYTILFLTRSSYKAYTIARHWICLICIWRLWLTLTLILSQPTYAFELLRHPPYSPFVFVLHSK